MIYSNNAECGEIFSLQSLFSTVQVEITWYNMSSVASDKIVPFGQYFVLDDMPSTLTLKERVAFCLCLIPKIRK